MSAAGSPAESRAFSSEIRAPIARSTSIAPVRRGFTPTSGIRISDPGTIAAPAIQNAAALASPGADTSKGRSAAPGRTVILGPSTSISAPIAASIRSVWSRDGPGSSIVLAPSARSAASSTALLTCADATGKRPRNGRSPRPGPRSEIGAVRPPFAPSAAAPIAASGSSTRAIGRVRSESSPVSVVSNGSPAATPASSRIVVPLLPQSSACSGSRNPAGPGLRTTTSPAPSSNSAPHSRRQDIVLRQSAPSR